jgi:hypothetical protein
VNIGAKIDWIKGQIEEIRSLLINWESKYKNLKPMTKIKKKKQPTLGLTYEFGKNAIELILKIKISIEDLIK